MRIGGKAPGGGPILSVGISALSAAGSRHLGSSIGSPTLNASASAEEVKDALFPEALACRTQDDALQCLASRDKPPDRDQQLACQRDDHRLARAYTAIGSPGLVPLRHCALFLKPHEPPNEFDPAPAAPPPPPP